MRTKVFSYEWVKDNVDGGCIRLAFGGLEDNCIWGSGVVTGSIEIRFSQASAELRDCLDNGGRDECCGGC